MTFKEYGENAEIVITVTISVNDEVAYSATTYDIDNAVEGLGSAERHEVINTKLKEQYENLPEPIEDESKGLAEWVSKLNTFITRKPLELSKI